MATPIWEGFNMKFVFVLMFCLIPLYSSAQKVPSGNVPSVPSVNQDSEVLLRLRAIHEAPNYKDLEAVSPDARRVVEDVVQDGEGFVRDRAISALATWGDDAAWQSLAPLFISTSTPEMTRHHLLLVLAQNFGDRSLGLVQAWLESTDQDKRVSAAQALAQIETERAQTLRDQWGNKTSDPEVLRWLSRSVR